MMLIRLLSVKSGMTLLRCVNTLGTKVSAWSPLNLQPSLRNRPARSLPGKYVFAGIRIGHGPELGDYDPVGLGVLLVGVALEELASVGHLT